MTPPRIFPGARPRRAPLPLRPLILFVLVWLPWAVACGAAAPPRLEHASFLSQAMGVDMGYAVWAPRDLAPDERLPLVVFLHGGFDDHRSFDRHGVGLALDAALAAGEIPRVIVVLPEGHLGFWANWRDGTYYYEDWVIYEAMPEVARTYHTAPCPEHCHVMGVSMGGAGTLRFIFHHPELFASAGVISAPIMDTDAMYEFIDNRFYKILLPSHRVWGHPPRTLIAAEDPFLQWTDPSRLGFRLFLAWTEGDRGAIQFGSDRLDRHLTGHGIAHGGGEFPGAHDWVSWTPVIIRALAYNVGGPDFTGPCS